MKKFFIFAIVALMAVLPMFANGDSEKADAGEAKEIVFKFSFQQGQNHPLAKGIQKFGEELESRSNGQMKLKIYYSGTLGNKNVTVQGLKTGTIDCAMLMSGAIADYGAPKLKVFSLPYLFDSVEHARRFEASDAGQELFDYVQTSGSKIVCVAAYQESARNYFFPSKEVKHPSDMKNMLIRCQEGSVYYDAIEAIGATAQSVAFGELFGALQAGVVDGAEQPLSGFVNNAFHEICKSYTLDGHELSPNLILFSESTWKSLTPEQQEIVREAAQASVSYFHEISDAADAEFMKTMVDAGVKIIDVDIDEWKDAVASVYDKYGSEYTEILEAVEACR